MSYKTEEGGKYVATVERWCANYKTCHYCGLKMAEVPLHAHYRVCLVCDTEHDRDINVAINIQLKGTNDLHAAGLVVSARGGLRKSTLSLVVADEVENISF
ncbi:zinc ribbon domain-containing protein [Thorsellia anophelis]|uniref:zinc ribbon domain-containing protein n=1 Tax=Thorsellia anophelis TaxID=336804 RepID=UPI001FDF4002|nr:zinc ribbon domain-containing protein [Thorsellia anophelis]